MQAGEDPETAALVRRLEMERMGMSGAALRRRAERREEDAEKRDLRAQLRAVTEERDRLADCLVRLTTAEIGRTTSDRPRLRLVGRDGA